MLMVGDEPDGYLVLERRLRGEGFEIMTSSGGEALWSAHSSWKPDVVLLHLGLDRVEGFLLCERLRAVDPGIVIIIVSEHSSEDLVSGGLNAGADDYITKPFSLDVVLARIRAHLRAHRAAAGDRQLMEHGDLWIDVRNYVLRVKGEWVDLRPQEFRVLASLARSYGEPLSRREIVRRVGGKWRDDPSRTVDVHISRIRTAVEARSDYRYIHTVARLGYRFEPVPQKLSPSESRMVRSRKASI